MRWRTCFHACIRRLERLETLSLLTRKCWLPFCFSVVSGEADEMERQHYPQDGQSREHEQCARQFRKTAARGRHVRIDETSEDDLSDAAAQEHRLMYQDVLNRLARLPEEQRSVLLLVAVEDLSYADAAKVLNIPVGTVMSRLSRARERLQQEIEGTKDTTPTNVVQMRSER